MTLTLIWLPQFTDLLFNSILAVGGSDAIISLWDTKEWISIRTLTKMEGPVRSLSFSFDGSYIVAGSDEVGDLEIVRTPQSLLI